MQSHSLVLAQQGQSVNRGGGGKTPGSREELGRDGTTQEMLQEPDLDQASEGETCWRGGTRQVQVSLSWENVSNHLVQCGEWAQEKLAFWGKVGRKKKGHQKLS